MLACTWMSERSSTWMLWLVWARRWERIWGLLRRGGPMQRWLRQRAQWLVWHNYCPAYRWLMTCPARWWFDTEILDDLLCMLVVRYRAAQWLVKSDGGPAQRCSNHRRTQWIVWHEKGPALIVQGETMRTARVFFWRDESMRMARVFLKRLADDNS